MVGDDTFTASLEVMQFLFCSFVVNIYKKCLGPGHSFYLAKAELPVTVRRLMHMPCRIMDVNTLPL